MSLSDGYRSFVTDPPFVSQSFPAASVSWAGENAGAGVMETLAPPCAPAETADRLTPTATRARTTTTARRRPRITPPYGKKSPVSSLIRLRRAAGQDDRRVT